MFMSIRLFTAAENWTLLGNGTSIANAHNLYYHACANAGAYERVPHAAVGVPANSAFHND